VTQVPFRLWPDQFRLMLLLMSIKLLVILKARQLGISWLVCAYTLWLCFFQEGRVALLFSQGQLEANELLRRIKAIYDRLPEWMKAAGPMLITSNTTQLAWSNGSSIQSLPATEKAGRSFTASLVVMDEFAFMSWGEMLYSALKPTIDGGGQLIILSTANGIGTLFHQLWKDAVAGVSNFTAVFLPWWSRPSRNQVWYEGLAKDAATPLQIQIIRQEYPATPEEAFISIAAERFLPDITLWDLCEEDLPPLTSDEPMVLAADAGVTDDPFGLVGITRHPERPDHVAVRYARRWLPDGGKVDFDEVEREIRRLCSEYHVVMVTYDPYQLHQMMSGLHADGVAWCSEFGQQAERLEADKALFDLIIHKRLAHDGNTDLREHIDNANAKTDPLTRKTRLIKRSQSLKIDLAVCASMGAYKCLELNL
jgi:hypothetical protein